MFSNVFLKSFRILLLPASLVYWFVVAIRNRMYNRKLLRSTAFGLPVICIGNLSVGGTGKSPMVEYLILILKERFRIATLSRGYKRRTRGYSLANKQSTAIDIGDEPMQFHSKFPAIPVAVGEERIVAIPLLLHDVPDLEAIILDDAFQHRAISAGLNILLTDYNNLYTRDFYLPTGDLRDLRSSAKRAHVIVVTKCKTDLSGPESAAIISELKPGPDQRIFFTSIQYDQPYHITERNLKELTRDTEVLLVAGIANPVPLKNMLEECTRTYSMSHYQDHHIFTIDDLQDIKKKFEKIDTGDKIILTTEKDAMRLLKFGDQIRSLPFYVIPVRHHFLFGEGPAFDRIVTNFITEFKRKE